MKKKIVFADFLKKIVIKPSEKVKYCTECYTLPAALIQMGLFLQVCSSLCCLQSHAKVA
jgi:hypothetical protein